MSPQHEEKSDCVFKEAERLKKDLVKTLMEKTCGDLGGVFYTVTACRGSAEIKGSKNIHCFRSSSLRIFFSSLNMCGFLQCGRFLVLKNITGWGNTVGRNVQYDRTVYVYTVLF